MEQSEKVRINTMAIPQWCSHSVVSQLGRGSAWSRLAPKPGSLDSSMFDLGVVLKKTNLARFWSHEAIREVRFDYACPRCSHALNAAPGVRK